MKKRNKTSAAQLAATRRYKQTHKESYNAYMREYMKTYVKTPKYLATMKKSQAKYRKTLGYAKACLRFWKKRVKELEAIK